MTETTVVSDAAKRIYDTYNLHKIGDPYGSIGKWFAARLSDGTGDNTLYDSKGECVRHQHHDEMYYVYVQITPGDMSQTDAQIWLELHRRMYEKNIRMVDPQHVSGGREVIKRATQEDMRNQIASMFGRGRPSNISLPGRDF